MVDTNQTMRDVEDIIYADKDGFWLLLDPEAPDEPRRREAFMTMIVAAWGKGYERGVRNGAKLMADGIVARINEPVAVSVAVNPPVGPTETPQSVRETGAPGGTRTHDL